MDDIEEKWYNLPRDTQWNLAIKVLKKQSHKLLELKPDNWNDIRFGNDTINDAIKIKKYIWEQK